MAATERLVAQGAEGLIVDLRGDPGGYLTQAIRVASLFLTAASSARRPGVNQAARDYTVSGAPVETKRPLVVLVDRHSASAAEIVAGALKDNGRATIVGRRTYGKATVQSLIALSNGGALKLTTAAYRTPNGTSIGGRGIRAERQGVETTRRPVRTRRSPPPRPCSPRSSSAPCPEPVVCELSRRGKLLVGEPFFEPRTPIVLDRKTVGEASLGDLVVVSVGRRRARIERLLGRAERDRDRPRGASLPHRPPGRPRAGAGRRRRGGRAARGPEPPGVERVDLRGLLAFTIDPDDARDFDDAISVRQEGEGLRAWVHIADVSAYVAAGLGARPGRRRAGAVRLRPGPGRADAPARAALAGLCSLVPNRDRFGVTVEIPFGRRARAR